MEEQKARLWKIWKKKILFMYVTYFIGILTMWKNWKEYYGTTWNKTHIYIITSVWKYKLLNDINTHLISFFAWTIKLAGERQHIFSLALYFYFVSLTKNSCELKSYFLFAVLRFHKLVSKKKYFKPKKKLLQSFGVV